MAEPRIFTSADEVKAAVGSSWGTPTGWTSTRSGSTCSRRRPATISGSTWTGEGRHEPFGTTIAHGYLTLSLLHSSDRS